MAAGCGPAYRANSERPPPSAPRLCRLETGDPNAKVWAGLGRFPKRSDSGQSRFFPVSFCLTEKNSHGPKNKIIEIRPNEKPRSTSVLVAPHRPQTTRGSPGGGEAPRARARHTLFQGPTLVVLNPNSPWARLLQEV